MQHGKGWRYCAATVLGIAGVMRLFDAIWAWSYKGMVPDNLQNALFGDNLSNYGWVYLIVAILLIGSSFGVLTGSQVARWIGIVAGGILTISAVWLMPYYPVSSLGYVGIGLFVIYALTNYGGRSATDGPT